MLELSSPQGSFNSSETPTRPTDHSEEDSNAILLYSLIDISPFISNLEISELLLN